MEKWVIAAKRADFNQIGQQFHIDPVIARLIRNRDVIGEDKIREYLSGTVASFSLADEGYGKSCRYPGEKNIAESKSPYYW